MKHLLQRTLLLLCSAWLVLPLGAAAQQPAPHAIDIPRWFTESFLDFSDDVAEAARDNKRVMVYFGQDGCPYCKALMQANFGPGPTAEQARRHFVALALNIWGDRELTWLDGRRMSEKQLARELGVQFTPTLLFLETDGRLALRLNGYQPPERFARILDYVVTRRDRTVSLAEHMADQVAGPEGSAKAPPPLAQPYLMRQPTRLARQPGGKPLAVLFEAPGCKPCAEMHAEAFTRPTLRPLMQRVDMARLLPGPPAPLTTPDGKATDTRAWARDLKIGLYPTVVFFDERGAEVFRFDGYMRPFHIESAFDFVASTAYRQEPQFQRFVQTRADRLRAAGQTVDLWR